MMRHVPIIRPTTPKSPAFNDMEGSDEEDHVLQNDDEQNYIMNEQMGVDGDGERDGERLLGVMGEVAEEEWRGSAQR